MYSIKLKFYNALPITPSCCGDNGLSCATPANEPDANDKRSDRATTEPPGDTERADTLDPAKEVMSDAWNETKQNKTKQKCHTVELATVYER